MGGGLYIPAWAWADFPIPNYVSPHKKGPMAPIVVGILGMIAVAVVIARYWSRCRLQRNAGLDDWVFLAAMPGFVGVVIGVILADTQFHSGTHVWDMRKQYVAPMRKLQLANYVCYTWASCLIKLSILLFYRRLTSKSLSPRFVYVLWGTMITNVAFFLASVVVVCFPCYPMWVYWSSYWTTGFADQHPGLDWHCLDEGMAVYYVALGGVILDLFTTLLPFSLFLRLRLPRRQKIAMCFTFMGGFIVCATAAARAWSAHWVYYKTYDMTYENYWFWFLTGIEICTAVICASTPSLKFYFRRYLDVPSTRVDQEKSTGSTASYSRLLRPHRDTDRKNRKKSCYSDRKPSVMTMNTATTQSPLSPMDVERGYFSVLSDKNGYGSTSGSNTKHLTPQYIGNNTFKTPATVSKEEWEALAVSVVRDWHGRTLSVQEDDLRAAGVISGNIVPTLPVAEHPVYYPWQDTAPQQKQMMTESWDDVQV